MPTSARIHGYGTVVIWADSVMERKKVGITLKDNSLGFHTSLVSADIGFQKGIHWDSERRILATGSRPFAKANCHHGLWKIEYNPSRSSTNEDSQPQGNGDSDKTVDDLPEYLPVSNSETEGADMGAGEDKFVGTEGTSVTIEDLALQLLHLHRVTSDDLSNSDTQEEVGNYDFVDDCLESGNAAVGDSQESFL
jgi:hypothetical protein